MNPSLLLEIAAIASLVQSMGHFTLFVRAKPKNGQEEVAVIEAMKLHRFNLSGVKPRSYWDLYFGYGLLAAFTPFLQSLLLWQLAGIVVVAPAMLHMIIFVFIFANIFHGALVWKYFTFPIPIVFDALIAILLGAALFIL